jgi:DNA modification methylase
MASRPNIQPVTGERLEGRRERWKKAALSNGAATAAVITGDALESLARFPDESFNTVVTSPPYYWARDYDVDGQIGHEDTVEAYVEALAGVFDEVKRVLHPDGVFYLNVGDTYYSGNGQPHGEDPRSPSRNFIRKKLRPVDQSGWGIPKKSMIGVPWKIAFELQQRGWTLRSDIIWNRVNAFVEPTARDRPHRQYEHVFLFSKSRWYSYDRSQLNGDQDVWTIPIERSPRSEHNAAFPRELVRRCVLTGSPPGGSVLDPFAGSGTTLEMSLELGRNCVGIDLSSEYTNSILRRLKAEGCKRATWKSAEESIDPEPAAWKDWPGNRQNFRKPRRKS